MGGKMLAINEKFGYRPILVVKEFNFLPQLNNRPPSTWFYGVQLMFQYDNPTAFVTFLKTFKGVPTVWSQLGIADNDTIQQVDAIWPKMPLHLVANETLTLLAGGKDPIRGYFLQFAGRIERLFTDPNWWKNSENIRF